MVSYCVRRNFDTSAHRDFSEELALQQKLYGIIKHQET
jgi:hypothetical protein